MRLLLFALAFAAGGGPSQKRPDPDRQLMERVCTACHGLDVFVTERHTRAEWQDIVDEMVSLGAAASPKQAKTLVDYLTREYPRPAARKKP